jgi:hypothetical protein
MADDAVKDTPQEEEAQNAPVLGKYVLYLVVVALAVGLPAMSILSGMSDARKAADTAVCKNNLKNIGLALGMYEMDKGKKPEKLSGLCPMYVKDLSVFLCPGVRRHIKDASEIDSKTCYVLIQPPADAGDGEKAVAYCSGCGPNEGRNVLLDDGRVVWMSQSKLKRILGE